jgi:hypothetical protein
MKAASNSPNAISKKFDEATYHAKMAQLAAASPKDAAEAATTVRKKLHNAMMDAQMATQKSIELLAAGGTAAALGMAVGKWEAEEAYIVDLWKNGGAASLNKDPAASSPFVDGGVSEPGKLMGIDTDLLVTLGLAALSIFNVAGKYTPFVSATAIGGAAFYVGNLTRKIAMENAATEIAKNPPKIEFKAAAA